MVMLGVPATSTIAPCVQQAHFLLTKEPLTHVKSALKVHLAMLVLSGAVFVHLDLSRRLQARANAPFVPQVIVQVDCRMPHLAQFAPAVLTLLALGLASVTNVLSTLDLAIRPLVQLDAHARLVLCGQSLRSLAMLVPMKVPHLL